MVTSLSDTLACDTAQLALWRSDPAYNYQRELVSPDTNLFEWVDRLLEKWLGNLLGSHSLVGYSEVLLICLAIIFLLLLIWFIYRKHPGFFMHSAKSSVSYTVEEDTIYGVDFPNEIAEALNQRDYKGAVRLLYLQTLKRLNDDNRIDWQPYKTPSQYNSEVGMPAFRTLTVHFLRVRYGNFEADETLFCQMKHLQEIIWKGGKE